MRKVAVMKRLLVVALCAAICAGLHANEHKKERVMREFDESVSVTKANEFLSEIQAQEFFDDPIRLYVKDCVDTLCQKSVVYWAAECGCDCAS